MNWINWYINFTAESIYGMIPILLLVYVSFFLLRKVFTKLPDPAVFTVLSFFIGIATIPSIPSYIFEKEILERYKYASHYKLIHSVKHSVLTEPLTLFNAHW